MTEVIAHVDHFPWYVLKQISSLKNIHGHDRLSEASLHSPKKCFSSFGISIRSPVGHWHKHRS